MNMRNPTKVNAGVALALYAYHHTSMACRNVCKVALSKTEEELGPTSIIREEHQKQGCSRRASSSCRCGTAAPICCRWYNSYRC